MVSRPYLVLMLLCFGAFSLEIKAQVVAVEQDSAGVSEGVQKDSVPAFSMPFDFKNSGRLSLTGSGSRSVCMPMVNHLPGVFCRMEYQLEKKSKLAPRFRLGSLEYTEWREGKTLSRAGIP